MRLTIKKIGKLFKLTFIEWFRKDPFRQSAVIAFYAIFSIPGLLFLIINITGYIFGKEVIIKNLLLQVSSTMGAEIGAQIEDMLTKVVQPKLTILASVLFILVKLNRLQFMEQLVL